MLVVVYKYQLECIGIVNCKRLFLCPKHSTYLTRCFYSTHKSRRKIPIALSDSCIVNYHDNCKAAECAKLHEDPDSALEIVF